jgi:excisionase family DNA binding protein
MEEYITTNEAAKILGVTSAALRHHARQGRFGAIKRAGVWFLRKSDVLEFKRKTAGLGLHDPKKYEVFEDE